MMYRIIRHDREGKARVIGHNFTLTDARRWCASPARAVYSGAHDTYEPETGR